LMPKNIRKQGHSGEASDQAGVTPETRPMEADIRANISELLGSLTDSNRKRCEVLKSLPARDEASLCFGGPTRERRLQD